ncbi:MAG: sodium ion-translocating decarboxylase subunit beta [Ruminococcus sp.]|nr:sodium ion-translocating decarboxylase subunit beta [Ruminococcus sp.]
MKKGLLIAGAAIMGGGGLGTVGLIAWFVYTLRREPEHIGIIGGADAPTAIFLADRLGVQLICVLAPLLLCTLVGAGLLAAAIIMHLIRKDPEG